MLLGKAGKIRIVPQKIPEQALVFLKIYLVWKRFPAFKEFANQIFRGSLGRGIGKEAIPTGIGQKHVKQTAKPPHEAFRPLRFLSLCQARLFKLRGELLQHAIEILAFLADVEDILHF